MHESFNYCTNKKVTDVGFEPLALVGKMITSQEL